MYTYSEIEYQLKLDLKSITERNNISEKDPLTHAQLIKLLPAWLPIYKKMLNTREIVSIEFFVANHKKDIVYIYPRFVEGYTDPDFQIRRGMYLLDKIESECIHFHHKEQWTNKMLRKLDDIDLSSDAAIEDVKNLCLLVVDSLENAAFVNAPISSSDPYIKNQNLAKYKTAIIKASSEGYSVFNTMPLQPIFDEICKYQGNAYDAEYDRKILLDAILFAVLEKCETLLQLPGWKYTIGGSFMHEKAIDLNMKIIPFDLGNEVVENAEYAEVYVEHDDHSEN